MAAEDACAETWRTICTRFFFENDSRYQEIISAFDAVKVENMSDPMTKLNAASGTFVINLTNDSFMSPETIDILTKLGCTVKDGSLSAPSELVETLQGIKNEVRASFHAQRSRFKENELLGVIDQVYPSPGPPFHGSVASGPDTDKKETRGGLAARQRLRSFIKTYQGSIGAHPFLKGVRALAEKQMESDFVVRWRVVDAVFTESAGGAFLSDAVHLFHDMNLHHSGPQTDADGTPYHDWYFAADMSDRRLRRLLYCLPPASHLDCRPTGELVCAEGVRRTNRKGEEDEERDVVDMLQQWCAVL